MLISHASKIMFKTLQARFQQYVKWELLDVQARFRKGEGSRNQILASIGSQKMQGNSRKTSTSVSVTMLKPLTVWITTNCGKFFKRWEYQTTLPAFWEICMQVKKQHFETNMEQRTGSKLGKEYDKDVYCYLAEQGNCLCRVHQMPGWMNPKLDSSFLGEISTTSDMQMIPN